MSSTSETSLGTGAETLAETPAGTTAATTAGTKAGPAKPPGQPSLRERRQTLRRLLEGAVAVLSPMAGVTDRVFRALCRERGADLTYCEFASAAGVLHDNAATRALLELAPGEERVGIQLFGNDPAEMAEAARRAEALGPDLIDLNFGCPVKKVVRQKGGSALLCDVPLMERIVVAVVQATCLPVTAKIRTGWSRDALNYLEVSRMLEESGVCAITCHGRTREQRFRGRADWRPIAEIKEQVTIPVLGNGDVCNASDYLKIKRETGCDAVMVARGAIGNPWIFEELRAAAEGRPWTPPDVATVVDTLVDHLDREIALKGERTGILRMRRQFASYLKGFPGIATLRKAVFAMTSRDAIVALFRRYKAEAVASTAALVVAGLLAAAGCSRPPRGLPSDPFAMGRTTVEVTVQEGETWASLAETFFGSPDAARRLADDNGLNPDVEPEPGQVLYVRIPPAEMEHVRQLAEARVPYNAGVEFLRAGDHDEEALEAFRTAVERAPDFVDAQYNLGLTLLRLGRPDEALAPLKVAATARPNDKDARYALASAWFHQGRYAEARGELEAALELDPGFLRARYTYALALERLGEGDAARGAWQAYLELDSTSAWAAEARSHLEATP